MIGKQNVPRENLTEIKIERPAPKLFFTETKMLTRAMTKEIEAKAEYIKMFIDNHKMIRNQPDRIYEQTIKWFRKHSIELPAGVRERSEREFVQIFMQWLGLPNCVPLTCSECKGTYTFASLCLFNFGLNVTPTISFSILSLFIFLPSSIRFYLITVAAL